MFKKTMGALSVIVFLILAGESSVMAEESTILFEFVKSDAADTWQVVNDGVMGGISEGRFRITADKTMEFFGTLSLENNGGFTSVRSRQRNLGLRKGDMILLRVRGDGREYSLNLYDPGRMMAFSYRAMFATKKDEWIEVRIPMKSFVATSFGEIVDSPPLDSSDINALGFLLSDKKAGPFKLEIEWIKVIRTK
jgi:NADH dehydrogenase [ubiquinone] 1 alpha subcomplex assembly factor 1